MTPAVPKFGALARLARIHFSPLLTLPSRLLGTRGNFNVQRRNPERFITPAPHKFLAKKGIVFDQVVHANILDCRSRRRRYESNGDGRCPVTLGRVRGFFHGNNSNKFTRLLQPPHCSHCQLPTLGTDLPPARLVYDSTQGCMLTVTSRHSPFPFHSQTQPNLLHGVGLDISLIAQP